MLRYSNRSIFSVMEESPAITMNNTGNITDPARFRQVLGKSIRDVAYRASGSTSGKKFADAEMNFTSLQKLYTMAQCTPDLMEQQCNVCLLSAIDILEGKQGGRTFTPSCNVRYELYPFYGDTPLPAKFSTTVAESEDPSPPEGKSKKIIVITISISVPVGGITIGLSLICLIQLLRR